MRPWFPSARGRGWLWIGLLLLLAFALSGCATAISRPYQDMARPEVSFGTLIAQPDAYKGRKVILGGYILEVSNEQGETFVTVLQTPLDHWLQPGDDRQSQGRFIIRTKQFLDPEVYAKDRAVTVGGSVAGSTSGQVGGSEYSYPLIDADELYLWPPPKPAPAYPSVYGPYYYPYWWDGYWWGYPHYYYPWGGVYYRHYPRSHPPRR